MASQVGPPGYDPASEAKPKTKSVRRNERKKEKRLQVCYMTNLSGFRGQAYPLLCSCFFIAIKVKALTSSRVNWECVCVCVCCIIVSGYPLLTSCHQDP